MLQYSKNKFFYCCPHIAVHICGHHATIEVLDVHVCGQYATSSAFHCWIKSLFLQFWSMLLQFLVIMLFALTFLQKLIMSLQVQN